MDITQNEQVVGQYGQAKDNSYGFIIMLPEMPEKDGSGSDHTYQKKEGYDQENG
jgi:hypothetical protein